MNVQIRAKIENLEEGIVKSVTSALLDVPGVGSVTKPDGFGYIIIGAMVDHSNTSSKIHSGIRKVSGLSSISEPKQVAAAT